MKNILLLLEKDMKIQRVPVVIEIDLQKLTRRGARGAVLDDPEAFKEAIDRGLRGQLQTESLVTGLLFVALDFFPGSPVNFVQSEGNHKYQEIPTVPTPLEKAQEAVIQILADLQQIDFKAFINSIAQTVNGINRWVNSPALKSAIQSLEQTIPKVD